MKSDSILGPRLTNGHLFKQFKFFENVVKKYKRFQNSNRVCFQFAVEQGYKPCSNFIICALLLWCHPGAEAVSGDDDDNPVITIVLPVAAALVLFAVIAAVVYRRRRGNPEYGGQYSVQYSAESGGARETESSRERGSSQRRESGASAASGASVDQSEYYEYDA